MKGYRNVPVTFNKVESIDSRFVKLKIVLMHLGTNFNGSSFDRETVEKAIPTLANTPILGFIEENMAGEMDFSDHRMEIVKDENGYKTKYLGSAYGVIPADNNARFEDIVGSDGVERTYLVCDGLMWTKFDNSIEIINNMTYRNQSMELDEDYDGTLDDSGIFHFTRFKFYGACILSNSVEPAMINAKVEKMFSTADYMAEIQEKMEEFKVSYSNYQQSLMDKEAKDMNMKEEFLKLLDKYHLTEEEVYELGFKIEDYETVEDMEAELAKMAETVAKAKEQAQEDEGKEEGAKEEFKAEEKPEEPEEEEDDLEKQITYLKEQSEVVQAEYEKLKTEYEALKEKHDELAKEAEHLTEFKATVLAKERQDQEDAIFEQFATQLDQEEMAPIKELASTMEIADIETALYALVGKKIAKFSKQQTKESGVVKVEFERGGMREDVTGYEYILKKHLK